MARLPTLDEEAPIRPAMGDLRYPGHIADPGAVGRAISGLGGQIEKQGIAADTAKDEDEYATAHAVFLTHKAELEAHIEQDPNWQTAPDTYKTSLKDAAAAAGATIVNPKYRKKFNETADVETAQGLGPILKMVGEKQKGQDLGDLDTQLDANFNTALNSPQNATSLIQNTSDKITAAVSKGTITPEDGVKRKKDWVEKYGKSWMALKTPEEQVRILTTPQAGAPPADGTATEATAAPKMDIHAALHGQESGNNPNAPDSPTGAVGIGQMEPATFKRFSKPGENIRDPKANLAASNRYIDYLSGLPNVQGDPARIAVGYYSGEGNIAPRGSATPYKQDRGPPKGVKGPKTSEYVAQVTGRMGGAVGTPAAGSRETAPVATTGTAADFISLPEREVMLRQAEAAVRADQAGTRAAFGDTVRDTIDFLHSGGDATQAKITPEQVRATLPDEEGAQLADTLGHAYDYASASKRIATMPESQIPGFINGKIPQGPEGFRASAAETGALIKAAKDRQDQIYGNEKTPGDPANYVTANFPDVAKAYAAAQPPDGKPPDPAKFAAYVQKMRGAQTALGIPAEYQRLLPTADAQAIVRRLQTGNPKDAIAGLQTLEKQAGNNWPQVYADLGRAGLPASFQALAVVQPADAQTMAAALGRDADAKGKGMPMVETMRGVKYDAGDGKAPKSVTDLVEQSMAQNTGLQNLRNSYGVFGRSGAQSFDSVYDAVRTTAFYLFQTRGLSPAAATQQAAAMVTAPFDFVQQPGHAPLRLPKDASGNFSASASHMLDDLQAKDLKPLPTEQDEQGHDIAGRPESERADQALTHARNAYWIAVPGADGRGAARAIDPQSDTPVLRANGKPLEIPFGQMQSMAIAAAKAGRAPKGTVSGGMLAARQSPL